MTTEETAQPTNQTPSTAEQLTKQFLLIFIVLMGSMAVFSWFKQSTTKIGGLAVGNQAPKIEAAGWIDGIDPTADNGLEGKVLVVDAFASWCGPCRREAPELIEKYNSYKDRDDIEFIGLTIQTEDEVSMVETFLESTQIPWPTGYGAEETLRQFEAFSVPMVWVIDKSGKVIWNYDSSEEMTTAIDRALK